jgi:glycosyltransferase involved in cell wall biosynthesis
VSFSKNPVSIIIPTYNRSTLLKRALESVLEQRDVTFEIIVVDDMSTDGTFEMIQSFNDSRIKYYCLCEKSGAQVARNYGVSKSQHELITFLDSDDIFLQGSLSVRVEYFWKHPECECSYSGYEVSFPARHSDYVKTSFFSAGHYDAQYKIALKRLIVAPVIVLMIRKSVFYEIGEWDTKLPSGHDDDIFLRCAKRGKCHYIAYVVARIVNHPGERVATTLRLAQGRMILIEKYKNDIISELGTKWVKQHYLNNGIDFLFANEFVVFINQVRNAQKYGSFTWWIIGGLLMKKTVYNAGRNTRSIIYGFK